jgi:ribonuclease Z
MPTLTILGSSFAIPDEQHENTHLVVTGENEGLLIDCPGNPVMRLMKAGIEPNRLTDVLVTHFHPDHVSGFPLLMMDLWLLGRTRPLRIHGLGYTLERVQRNMALYDWEDWPGFFPVQFNYLEETEMFPVQAQANEAWRVYSSPVEHMIPNVGVRVEFLGSGKTLAYSSDTQPCPQVVRLARGVDVLIHESTGVEAGHTGPAQAGEIAQEAGAKRLYLIHYPTGEYARPGLAEQAAEAFGGPVALAEDLLRIEF